MDRNNNKNNNIFSWATKELSQDAIVAWLLNGEFGKKFLKSLLNKNCPNSFEIKNVITQIENIDVLVELENNGNLEAVIIEDKTKTFLHSDQLFNYICNLSHKKNKNGNNTYSKIYYVLFKSVDVKPWEIAEYERQFNVFQNNKEIKYEDLLDYYPNTKLLLSGNKSNDKKIVNNSIKRIDDIVLADRIYTRENFICFLEDIFENNHSFDDEMIGYIIEYYKSNCENKDEIIKAQYRVISKKYPNCKIRMMLAENGGGDPNLHIFCDSWFSDTFNTEVINKVSDNFLMIPIISFKSDGRIQLKINFNIVYNLNIKHGFQSHKGAVDALNGIISKEQLFKWKKSVWNFVNEKNIYGAQEFKKENAVQLISWTVDQKDFLNIENEIEKLTNIANEISSAIKENGDAFSLEI